MYQLLSGLTVVEASSFIAAPSAGLYLAQFGATVVRVDQIGGGPDFRRWPLAASGESLYWEGLNKAKQSVALDLGKPEGRALLTRLATAPGTALFLTNFPAEGFLAHDRLAALRPDLITVRVMGRADGGPALDYTVNAAIGFPMMTGPANLGDAPVNHVLPAWDLMTGAYAAFAALAALRHREATGQGQEVRVPLADIGITAAANIGMLAESLLTGADRPRLGNALFGAFGRDFVTADHQRLMLIAISPRQWSGLVETLGLADDVAAIEAELGVSFATDEGVRFQHRERLFVLVEAAVSQRRYADLVAVFEPLGVCYGRFSTLRDAADAPGQVQGNPLFSTITHPSGETYPAPGAAATFTGLARQAPRPAPRLGADSGAVLQRLLGMADDELAMLRSKGVVAP